MLLPRSLLFTGILGLLVNAQSDRGTIGSPANGTVVMPGEYVPFYYYSMGEYSVTSYNLSIWLYTSDPQVGLFTGQTTGVSLGTWSYSSSTNDNPSNPPPPSSIYIPDFSRGVDGFASGFGGGVNATNATIWLSVFEEYGTGTSFGARIAYTSNQLIYNSTSGGNDTTS